MASQSTRDGSSTVGVRLTLLCCLAGLLLPALAPARDDPSDTDLLQAAFIFNFAKLTRWPPGTTTGQQFRLCIAGQGGLAGALNQLARQTIQGLPVTTKMVTKAGELSRCRTLFVASSEHARAAQWIENARGRPVLTISRIRGFADTGGMIQLYRDHNRIRFLINLDAARAEDLRFSARLLELADLVGKGFPE